MKGLEEGTLDLLIRANSLKGSSFNGGFGSRMEAMKQEEEISSNHFDLIKNIEESNYLGQIKEEEIIKGANFYAEKRSYHFFDKLIDSYLSLLQTEYSEKESLVRVERLLQNQDEGLYNETKGTQPVSLWMFQNTRGTRL